MTPAPAVPAPAPGARVLDPAALGTIAVHLEDTSLAAAFASRYRSLLDRRVARIVQALDEADLDRAMDALLSLKVSSSSVGAGELEALAVALEADVRRMDLGAARRRVAGLREAADRAHLALAAHLTTAS